MSLIDWILIWKTNLKKAFQRNMKKLKNEKAIIYIKELFLIIVLLVLKICRKCHYPQEIHDEIFRDEVF